MAIFVVMVAADPVPRLLESAGLCPVDQSLSLSDWVAASGLLAQPPSQLTRYGDRGFSDFDAGRRGKKMHGEKTSNNYAADQQHCSTGAIRRFSWHGQRVLGGGTQRL